MTEKYFEISQIRTKAFVYANDVDNLKSKERVILIVPGNPGVPDFYKKFCQSLYEKCDCKLPIVNLGHCGHDDSLDLPDLEGFEDSYSVEGQIKHKVEFIKKYLGEETKIIIIAHSIGAYITMKMLENDEIQQRVEKCYLLFPVIDNISKSRSGNFLNFAQVFHPFFLLTLWILAMLPNFFINWLLYISMTLVRIPKDNMKSLKKLLQLECANRILFMAYNELKVVRDFDSTCLNDLGPKIKFYFGLNDSWIQKSYFFKLEKSYPTLDIEVASARIHHAFVLKSSTTMASIVSLWLKSLDGDDVPTS